uniref:Uncharacterized protein n=1 Tax=Tetradesmus obliquus TaxID=3088 RepID=A0A383W229_TETOB|eukprot:jgi/Sobl393_1/16457/SZX71189.1
MAETAQLLLALFRLVQVLEACGVVNILHPVRIFLEQHGLSYSFRIILSPAASAVGADNLGPPMDLTDALFYVRRFCCALHVPVMEAAGKPVTMQLGLWSLVPFAAHVAVLLLHGRHICYCGDSADSLAEQQEEQQLEKQLDWARTMDCPYKTRKMLNFWLTVGSLGVFPSQNDNQILKDGLKHIYSLLHMASFKMMYADFISRHIADPGHWGIGEILQAIAELLANIGRHLMEDPDPHIEQQLAGRRLAGASPQETAAGIQQARLTIVGALAGRDRRYDTDVNSCAYDAMEVVLQFTVVGEEFYGSNTLGRFALLQQQHLAEYFGAQADGFGIRPPRCWNPAPALKQVQSATSWLQQQLQASAAAAAPAAAKAAAGAAGSIAQAADDGILPGLLAEHVPETGSSSSSSSGAGAAGVSITASTAAVVGDSSRSWGISWSARAVPFGQCELLSRPSLEDYDLQEAWQLVRSVLGISRELRSCRQQGAELSAAVLEHRLRCLLQDIICYKGSVSGWAVISDLLAPHSCLALLLLVQQHCESRSAGSGIGVVLSSMRRKDRATLHHMLAPTLLELLFPAGEYPAAAAAAGALQTISLGDLLPAAVTGRAVADDDNDSEWSGMSALGDEAWAYMPGPEMRAVFRGAAAGSGSGAEGAEGAALAWVQEVPASLQPYRAELAQQAAEAAAAAQQQHGGSSSSQVQQSAPTLHTSGSQYEMLQLLCLVGSSADADEDEQEQQEEQEQGDDAASEASKVRQLAAVAEGVLHLLAHTEHSVVLLGTLYGFLGCQRDVMRELRAAECSRLCQRWLRLVLQLLIEQQQQQQPVGAAVLAEAAAVLSQLLQILQDSSGAAAAAADVEMRGALHISGDVWAALQHYGEQASKLLAAELAAAGGLLGLLLFMHRAVSLPWPLGLPAEAAALFDCLEQGLGIKCWLPAAVATAGVAGTSVAAAAAAAPAGAAPLAEAAMSGARGSMQEARAACLEFLQQQQQQQQQQPWHVVLHSMGNEGQQLAGWVSTGWYTKLI